MRLTLALLALFAATGCAHAEDEEDAVFRNGDWVVETASTLTIRSDNGGNIHDYADLIATLTSKEVRIVGVCKSSCTMFLGQAPRTRASATCWAWSTRSLRCNRQPSARGFAATGA
jgi:hypothetical protein